jgi:putative spermidine/putrescine transport system permease protein
VTTAPPQAQRASRSDRILGKIPAWNRQLLFIAPAFLLIGIFFVGPYLYLLYMSFMSPTVGAPYESTATLSNYRNVMTDSFNWRIIRITLQFGFLTTIITLILSYPLAYHLARSSSRIKGLLLILILSPLLVGIIIRSYGWMILLADTGLVNQTLGWFGLGPYALMYNKTGVMIALVHIYMPFMVLSLAGALQTIDPDIERASRSLGGSPWQTFWRVTWPLSMPGVASGTVLVFVLSISAYVIPSLLGGYNVITLPLLVVQTVSQLFNWPLGSALAMVFFAITVGIIWVYTKILNRAMKGLG